ncbi:MAG: hypothetical protein LM601_08060 [Candidatus Verstraetearchaeota archaeon]|nr:hypothetical protein [Candidatus Verstraetearchaeota archaeon]
MGEYKGEFWLIYVYSNNPKKCMLGIKFPSIESRYYIILGGKRASELYNHILLTLDNNGVEYSVEKEGNKCFIKLPWSTGLAVAVFLLAVYAKRKPLSYIYILDKMIHGGMPLMRHLTSMIELALDLTEYLKNQQQKRLVSHASARTVSKIMSEIITTIKNY